MKNGIGAVNNRNSKLDGINMSVLGAYDIGKLDVPTYSNSQDPACQWLNVVQENCEDQQPNSSD